MSAAERANRKKIGEKDAQVNNATDFINCDIIFLIFDLVLYVYFSTKPHLEADKATKKPLRK